MISKVRPIFLVLAAANSPEGGVTGAAIGTETVTRMLQDNYEIERLVLRTNGLGLLGSRSKVGRMVSMGKAAFVSLGALAKLALRGLSGPRVQIIYFLPAASTMGLLRNVGIVLVVQLFHRRAMLVFHIRNGNYFDHRSPWKEHLQRYVNRRAFRILVLSRLLLPCDLHRAGVKESQLRILPNTIDESVQSNVRRRVELPPPLKLLYLSNFIVEKGYLALLSAAERLAERGLAQQFAFTFHGKWLSQEEREAACIRAEKLCNQGLSVVIGNSVYDRREVQTLYASHHVFCLPTRYAAEAQPRSVLEAMANGCAVLATRFRSIPEQVVDGETGLLVENQDPDHLADRLAELLECDLEAMGQAGREHFDKKFSRVAIEQKLLDALGTTSGKEAAS